MYIYEQNDLRIRHLQRKSAGALYYTMMYYTILYYNILYYTIIYYTMIYYTIL